MPSFAPAGWPRRDLREWLSAADAVLFNYRAIFTSGAACLARSYGVPMLMPRRLQTVELDEPSPLVFRFDLDGDLRRKAGAGVANQARLRRCGAVARSHRVAAHRRRDRRGLSRGAGEIAARAYSSTPMCGIAGFIDRSLPEPEAHRLPRRMLGRIAHRGPDGAARTSRRRTGSRSACGGSASSISKAARQPIWNEDRTVGVVFNGEIYNYVELRRELRAAGHVLRTRSDTEVLVHLYEKPARRWSSSCAACSPSRFSICARERLLIARDHFGQKPLYYTRSGERFAFASELK